MALVVESPVDAWTLQSSVVEDFERVAAKQDLWLALVGVGWIHFSYGCVRQWFEQCGWATGYATSVLWAAEMLLVVLAMRWIAGSRWVRATPVSQLILRTWLTYVGLGLIAATWNASNGWELEWYRPVLLLLGAFGLASLAWATSAWLAFPAAFLAAAGFLVLRVPDLASLIDASAWALVLQLIGLAMAARRSKVLARPHRPMLHTSVRVHIPMHYRKLKRAT
jgi:hypothetical protein